jgi:hypothetical protein
MRWFDLDRWCLDRWLRHIFPYPKPTAAAHRPSRQSSRRWQPSQHAGALDGDRPIPTRTQELPSRLCYALRRPKRTPSDQTLTGDEVRAAQPRWSVDHGTVSATTRRLARPSRRFRQVSGRAASVRHYEANRPNPWLRTATMDFAHGGTLLPPIVRSAHTQDTGAICFGEGFWPPEARQRGLPGTQQALIRTSNKFRSRRQHSVPL